MCVVTGEKITILKAEKNKDLEVGQLGVNDVGSKNLHNL
jgi:hypothetical protein